MRRIRAYSDLDEKLPAISRRLALIGVFWSSSSLALAGCVPPKVLFVCPAGTVKSAIARETLKQRAAARGVAVSVQSRGLAIEDHVSPALAERLRIDGVDPKAEPARVLKAPDIAWADIVIAFDEAAQAPPLSRARAWATPSWNSDYDKAKVDLDRRLDALLAELATRACAP